MCNEPFGRAKNKKMIIAIARRFAVDWWRINTGKLHQAVGVENKLSGLATQTSPRRSFGVLTLNT